jgi:hypothetical protein
LPGGPGGEDAQSVVRRGAGLGGEHHEAAAVGESHVRCRLPMARRAPAVPGARSSPPTGPGSAPLGGRLARGLRRSARGASHGSAGSPCRPGRADQQEGVSCDPGCHCAATGHADRAVRVIRECLFDDQGTERWRRSRCLQGSPEPTSRP